MSIILRKVHTKDDLDSTQDKRIFLHNTGCHGNQVTIAMRYFANAYCPKEVLY